MLVGFSAIALFSSFWGIIRADALLARGDNPRRAISDRYVYRGTIVDNNNTPLTASVGAPGEYERVLLYPELSSVVGYSDPNFGQAGIESKLDGILRGITNNTPTEITTTRLLYGQDPEGYDLRLSLNLALQQTASQLLSDYTGAIVVLNANSGEIIVMATSPTFDANRLDENWSEWMVDESAPLLNRATQGLYPPGTTTSGVMLARFLSNNTVSSAVPDYPWNTTLGSEFFCAINPGRNNTWGELISAGCIKAIATVNHTATRADTLLLYRESGLFQELNLPLETSPAVEIEDIASFESLYNGQAGILVSPLHVAVMGSTLSNGGIVVTPQIAMAYKKPASDWTLIGIDADPMSLSHFAAVNAARELSHGTFQGWEISSVAKHEEATIAWYVTGTPPDWLGTPITLVVALEDGSALHARSIGRELFLAATANIAE